MSECLRDNMPVPSDEQSRMFIVLHDYGLGPVVVDQRIVP
jgi:hypothetical protein